MRACMLPCPRGFNFQATADVLRRGPSDPLIWFDGRRWRRRLAIEDAQFLLEVCLAPARAAASRAPARTTLRLSVRVLAGEVPRPLVERVAARLFGLDNPAPRLFPRLSDAVPRATLGLPAAALPGYPTLFEAIVHTVLGQQISAVAANVHRAAFTRRFGRPFVFHGTTYWTFPAPADVAAERLPSLRRPGLTAAKAFAVRSVARALENGAVSETALETMPPETAIGTLTALSGIGRWTAEWVLLRGLRRFDIVPAGDLALRKAVTWFARRTDLVSETEVRELAAAWRPYAGLLAFRLLLAHRQTVA